MQKRISYKSNENQAQITPESTSKIVHQSGKIRKKYVQEKAHKSNESTEKLGA